ncbi:hypothetical protein ID866_10372 [Astraeus odoratus]|nr:hypothetical protein ID866_10372 [Astraeus odoratus]
MQEIVAQYDLPNVKGHSLCIGGTLHYLLLGTPFEVVKTMGRWLGKSFTHYLWKHTVILAPYLHNRPDLIDKLTHLTLPPVH